MKHTHFHARVLNLGLCIVAMGGTAHAASKKSNGMSASSSGGGKEVDRDFLISGPVVAETPQGRVHLEYNIVSAVGLAVEGAVLGEHDLFDEKQIKETGESLKITGYQGSLLLSRYTEPSRLGGFFWTIGGGYRRFTGEWQRKPEDKTSDLRLDSADENGYLHHRIIGQGTTATARIGYRWVAAEWPVAIGGHIGVRHMNTTVKDVEVDPAKEEELKLQYSATDKTERKELQNMTMTTPDVSIEIGLIF